MDHIFVVNGEPQLILSQDNEIERDLLKELIDNGKIEIDWIRQPVGVLGKSVKDGIVIRKKQEYADTSEA